MCPATSRTGSGSTGCEYRRTMGFRSNLSRLLNRLRNSPMRILILILYNAISLHRKCLSPKQWFSPSYLHMMNVLKTERKICSKKFRLQVVRQRDFLTGPNFLKGSIIPSKFGYKGSDFSQITTLHVTKEFSWSIWQCRTKNYSVTK